AARGSRQYRGAAGGHSGARPDLPLSFRRAGIHGAGRAAKPGDPGLQLRAAHHAHPAQGQNPVTSGERTCRVAEKRTLL
ncbi:uncharacterized protein METZ01_LOCUS252824, partial [marine metagenome]